MELHWLDVPDEIKPLLRDELASLPVCRFQTTNNPRSVESPPRKFDQIFSHTCLTMLNAMLHLC